MNIAYNLIDFIKMYYFDSNIPMYLFFGEKCIFCMPQQTDITYPPQKYIHDFLISTKRLSYCTTEYGISFCSLKIDYTENRFLVFGPITSIPYTTSDLQHIYKDYTIPIDNRPEFNLFLRQIPCLSLTALLKKCIFLNYCLHKETLNMKQFSEMKDIFSDPMTITDASFLETTYQTKENEHYNQTYAIEEQLLNLVRTGDYEGLKDLEFSDSNFHTGVTASTALRQLKNNIIITTTLCTRAAIDGGVDYDTAYQLSDYFIQASDRLTSTDQLNGLLAKISYTFAEKVARAKTPTSSDGRMQKAIHYI